MNAALNATLKEHLEKLVKAKAALWEAELVIEHTLKVDEALVDAFATKLTEYTNSLTAAAPLDVANYEASDEEVEALKKLAGGKA